MKKYLKYIIIAILVIAAITLYSNYRKKKSRPEWRTDQSSMGPIREVVTATGSLNPYILVEVGTEVSGKIEKIYKDFNDRVRKGDLLAKLDTELLKTALESAKSDVAKATTSAEEAKLDYDLLKELVQKKMAAEYDMMKAQFKHQQAVQTLANARLTLQRAQKNLDNAFITSPIDGIIVARSVDEGQTVAASMSAPTLFKIANNLDKMQITANVDEADIGKVSVGLPVEFSVDAYPTQRFNGEVKQIRLNPTTEQNVVSYSVIIDASNPGQRLLPGMTTSVTIVIQSKPNVMRIPESATRFRPSKEIWTLFGLEWQDDMVANARKKAMEEMQEQMKKAMSPAQDKTEASAEAQTAKANPGERPQNPAANPGQRPQGGKRPEGQANMQRGGEAPADTNSAAKRPHMPGGGAPSGMPGRGGFSGAPGGSAPSGMPSGSPMGFSGRGMGGGRSGGGMAVVWVLKNNKPELHVVRTGISDGANVEVISGLDPSWTLITGVNFKDAKQAAASTANPMQGGPGMNRRF